MPQNMLIQFAGRTTRRRVAPGAIPKTLEALIRAVIFSAVDAANYKFLWRPREDHSLCLREDNVDVLNHVRRNKQVELVLIRNEHVFVQIPKVNLGQFAIRFGNKH